MRHDKNKFNTHTHKNDNEKKDNQRTKNNIKNVVEFLYKLK